MRIVTVALCVLAAGGAGIGCQPSPRALPARPDSARLPGQTDDVFTTARPSLAVAVNDFLVRRPVPVQPIEFPHDVHAGRRIACDEYCHEGVSTQAVAGLPSLRTCMICHNTIATDRPRIQSMTAMRAAGRDLAWQRVFDYPPSSHVRFNHAPHIRTGIECSTCHGDIAGQTVARRNVALTMGFCVTCHDQQQASVDCQSCHY